MHDLLKELMKKDYADLEALLLKSRRDLTKRKPGAKGKAKRQIPIILKAMRCKGQIGCPTAPSRATVTTSPYDTNSFGEDWREQD